MILENLISCSFLQNYWFLSIFLQEEPKPKETLYLYETDKILAERNKKYIN